MPEPLLFRNNLPDSFETIQSAGALPDEFKFDIASPRFETITGEGIAKRQPTHDELDINKLKFDIANNAEVSDQTARTYSAIWLANRYNTAQQELLKKEGKEETFKRIDPFEKGIYEARARNYFGEEHDLTEQEIYAMIRDVEVPALSSPDWKSFDSYVDVIQRKASGEDVPDIKIEDTVGKVFKESVLGIGAGFDRLYKDITGGVTDYSKYEVKQFEDAEIKLFNESSIAQRLLGENVMSQRARDFAFRSLATNNFNEATFMSLSEVDKEYFHTYLSAINTKKDLGFVEEIGTRIKQSGYDIADAFESSISMIEKNFVKGAMDPQYMYENTKGMTDSERRTWVEGNVNNLTRMHHLPVSMGKAAAVAQAQPEVFAQQQESIREVSEARINSIMANIDKNVELGKLEHEKHVANRKFINSARAKFIDREGITGTTREMFMGSVSIGLDLAAAAAAGIGTGGVGTLAYSGGRFAGNMYESLVYDYKVAPEDAFGIAVVTSVPYAFIEKAQIGLLTKGVLKSGKEVVKNKFKSGWQKFATDYIKTYGAEVTQETAQSFIEQMGTAYADEFHDAEGVRYEDLLQNIMTEGLEAAKSMAFISLIGPGGRSGVGQRAAGALASKIPFTKNKYGLNDRNKKIDEMASEVPHNFDTVENVINTANETQLWTDYKLAEDEVSKLNVLKNHRVDMDIAEADQISDSREQVKKDVEAEFSEDLADMESQINQVTKQRVQQSDIEAQVGKYGKVIPIGKSSYEIRGEGGAAFGVNIMTEADYQAKFNGESMGVWSGNNITLPDTATDIKLSHEFTHAMIDLKLIREAEYKKMLKYAKKIIDVDQIKETYEKAGKILSEKDLNDEALAHMQEVIKRDGAPPELETIWEKIKAYIQDLISKVTGGRITKSAKTLTRELGEGKFLERKAEATTVGVEKFSIGDIKTKWAKEGVNLSIQESASDIAISGMVVPKDKQNQGIGTELVNDLTSYADSVNKTLRLTPADKGDFEGTTSRARLKAFYKRFGFVENKGKNRDFEFRADEMYRLPRDLKHSIEQNADPDRIAVVNLAKALYKGVVTEKDVNEHLAEQGIESEAKQQEIISKANAVIAGMTAEFGTPKGDVQINEAIRVGEIRQYFADKMSKAHKEAFRSGEAVAKAVTQLKKQVKAEKQRTFRVPSKVREAAKDIEFLEDVEGAVTNILSAEGIDSKKSSFENVQSVKAAVDTILRREIQQVPPGRAKDNILKKIKNIKNLKQASGIIAQAEAIRESINNAKIKQTATELEEEFNKILDTSLKRVAKKTILKSKEKEIDKLTGQFLRLTKQLSTLPEAAITAKIYEVQKMLNDQDTNDTDYMRAKLNEWSEQIPSLKKKFISQEQVSKGMAEDLPTKLIILNKALIQFGAMKSKTLVEKKQAIEALNDVIAGSVARLEKARAEMNREANIHKDAIIPGVKGKDLPATTVDKMVASFTGPAYGIKSLMKASLKNSVGDKKAKAQTAYDELFSEISNAENRKDIAVMKSQEALFAGIAEVYNIKPKNVLNEMSKLTKLKKEYGKYSKQGNNKLSKLHLIQFVAVMDQQAYAKNKTIQSRNKEGMLSELNEQDLALLEWFKEFYEENRAVLSAKVNEILGVPIQQDDPNYVPAVIKRDKTGLPNVFSGTTIVPPALAPRVDHQNDIDEDYTILDIFIGRNEQNNMFIEGANTMQMLEMVFGDPEMHKSIEKSLGPGGHKYFYAGIQDWINNGWQFDSKWKALDYVRNFFTISKFMYNPRIGIKQITSIPAFALEMPMMDVAKYMATAFTPDGWKAMNEILNIAETLKQGKFVGHNLTIDRIDIGPLEEIRHLMGSTPNKLRAFMKHAMIFNKLGDIIPTMLIGQGILRANTELYSQNMPLAEAKEKAMFDVFKLAQLTQQSGKNKEKAFWQRRFGSAGRTAAIFTNTTRQFLEFELVAAQNLIANPKDIKNWKQMGKVAVINHLLLPAAYQGMNILINMILGDEPDEDDALTMMLAMISGPFSGYIFFGSLVLGLIDTIGRSKKVRKAVGLEKARGVFHKGKGFTPMTSILDDAKTVGEIITSEDMDEAEKKFLNLMKSTLAPVREFEKFRKNQ